MGEYSRENWERFQRTGVKSEDIKAMKLETVEDAFEDTKEDFDNLVGQLKEGIKEGKWTSIIGDDVSGRLTALVIGKIAGKYAHKHNIEAPKQLFIAGGGIGWEDLTADEYFPGITSEQQLKLEDYINSIKEKIGPNTLFVTEHIVGGKTMERVSKALKKVDIDIDIATLWATHDPRIYYDALDKIGRDESSIFIGREDTGLSGPFGSNVGGLMYDLGIPLDEAGGVKKVRTEPITKRDDKADRELIRLARKKVNELAGELYEKHFGEENE